jgi:hypothetical protein
VLVKILDLHDEYYTLERQYTESGDSPNMLMSTPGLVSSTVLMLVCLPTQVTLENHVHADTKTIC